MPDEIILTPQELEDIKDEVRFRAKTTITLKYLTKKVDKLNGLPDRVKTLETHKAIQWWIISGILIAIVSAAVKVLLK